MAHRVRHGHRGKEKSGTSERRKGGSGLSLVGKLAWSPNNDYYRRNERTSERASLGSSERPSIFESSVGGFVFACFQRAPFSLASESAALSFSFKRTAFSTSCRARCHAVETPDEHRYEVNRTRVGHSSPCSFAALFLRSFSLFFFLFFFFFFLFAVWNFKRTGPDYRYWLRLDDILRVKWQIGWCTFAPTLTNSSILEINGERKREETSFARKFCVLHLVLQQSSPTSRLVAGNSLVETAPPYRVRFAR